MKQDGLRTRVTIEMQPYFSHMHAYLQVITRALLVFTSMIILLPVFVWMHVFAFIMPLCIKIVLHGCGIQFPTSVNPVLC